MELKQKNLNLLTGRIDLPIYNRDKLKPGIVHIGVGGFHRAHQAYYTDELLNKKGSYGWSICGIGIREEDKTIFNALKQQDFLYTLVVKHPDGNLKERIIGSIIDYIFAPLETARAIKKMADYHTKIVSLTITEGGYNFDHTTGEFIFESPNIQYDLNNPGNPKTVFGYLAAALRIRKEKKKPAFTVLSCDNLQHNGDITKKMLLSFTEKLDIELSKWIEASVSFPNCMVDRITPVTTDYDKERLFKNTGIKDDCPVTCEPYIQWVIEDNFSNGRPRWEDVGVQFVNDIAPYEKMKIRLLNAGHSLLGMTGLLLGYHTIDETVNVPILKNLLLNFMNREVKPILDPVKEVDFDEYMDCLIQRFGNPNLKDPLIRICSESSAKLPKFLIPTIIEQLAKNGPIKRSTLILAAWCCNLEKYGSNGYGIEIQDDMLDILVKSAQESVSHNPLAFLMNKAVFGDLILSQRFVETYILIIEYIRKFGIYNTILKLDQIVS